MRFTKQKTSDPITPWHTYVNGRGHTYHKTKANADKELQAMRKKYRK